MIIQTIDYLAMLIVSFLPKSFVELIALDKAKHLAVGFLFGLCGGGFAIALGYSAWFSVFIAAFIGVVKEVYDAIGNAEAAKQGKPPSHSVEVLDFVYTTVGGVLAFVVFKALLFSFW